jgi:16S rRNA (cytosine967-C5)-methyltransferase
MAASIIEASDREHPADQTLRSRLGFERDLSPASRAAISQMVFNYYRWRGWLKPAESLSRQLQHAAELAANYAIHPEHFGAAGLAERAIPSWLRREMDIREPWLRALQQPPALWLRAHPGKGGALARTLEHSQSAGAGWLADALHYTGQEDLYRAPEFHRGEFEIQDLHSQAVSVLCAPKPGETWWDACAGEGGKTLHLADLMQNKGLLWASDRSVARLTRLKRRMARAQLFNYRTAPWDGSAKLPTKTLFHGVLVDAPCANIGTWQRNPHARWTSTPADVAELARTQLQLLTHATAAVRPGGRLIYAVCTLTRAETTAVVAQFAAARPNFVPLACPSPFDPAATPSAQHTFSPEDRLANGMFVALWQRPL